MNVLSRLWVRITLAFTLVVLIAVAAIAILINLRTGAAFREYIVLSGLQASGSGIEALATYYQQQGSWEGVDALLESGISITGPMGMPMPGMPMGRWGNRFGGRLDVQLANARGQVVYDSGGHATGRKLTAEELDSALPISASDDGEVVGYLLLYFPGSWERVGELEQDFIQHMQKVLIAGTALAVGLGLIMGILLSRSLTAPLQRLAAAARAVAGGDLGRRVEEQGTVEVADVARAFNEMTSELERAERLRQNLVADVAHELRTPLSVLQGNLHAILDDVYPLDKAEIAHLYDETRLLSRLVDDLRELALADAGQLSINLGPTDITAVLKTAADNFEPVAESAGIQLALDLASNLPTVLADPDRVAQVLRNLFANALRHTPKGGRISVSVRAIGDAVAVSVTDSGEGISSEDLPHVFERFWRADRSRSRPEGGAGLGLAIARALVEAHGGEILAASEGPGKGSTFTFTLPTQARRRDKATADERR